MARVKGGDGRVRIQKLQSTTWWMPTRGGTNGPSSSRMANTNIPYRAPMTENENCVLNARTVSNDVGRCKVRIDTLH